MPLWLLCGLLQWCTSILIPQGSTGSWSREGTGPQCFLCPCSEAGTGNVGGELGGTDIRSGRGEICEISSFRTPGINFSDGLHLPYDCSTSLLTLNCLEIKKGGQKKKEPLTLPVGAYPPTEQQRPHSYLRKRNTGLLIAHSSNLVWITWRVQENT